MRDLATRGRNEDQIYLGTHIDAINEREIHIAILRVGGEKLYLKQEIKLNLNLNWK